MRRAWLNSALTRTSIYHQGARVPISRWNVIFWASVVVVSAVMIHSAMLLPFRPDQIIYLARNFAFGNLAVDDMPHIYPDYVVWQGHTYLPVGPLVGIVVIPFLPLIDAGVSAGWISVILTLVNVWLLLRTLSQIQVDEDTRRWSALLFFGGTVYLGVATTIISWYLAQVLTTTCLLLSIRASIGQARPFLVGLLLGFAAMTRLSTVFALPFFVWLVLDTKSSHDGRIQIRGSSRKVAELLLGLSGPLMAIAAYNILRFGTPIETGYGLTVLGSPAYEEARSQGLFSLVHIPKNLFLLLLQGPLPYPSENSPTLLFPFAQPTPWGMSLFLTSPALIYAFSVKLRERLAQACWLAIAPITGVLLLHFGAGWVQFGFRYSLDFMPFLLLLAALGISGRVSYLSRLLVLLSVLVNLWGVYWLHRWLLLM